MVGKELNNDQLRSVSVYRKLRRYDEIGVSITTSRFVTGVPVLHLRIFNSDRLDGFGGAGNFSSLLQYLDKGHDAADVQFWKRMADPVLVHDSFSSFLWLLFCLPLPFPANGAPFTALVHLFYLVSITQVLLLDSFVGQIYCSTGCYHVLVKLSPRISFDTCSQVRHCKGLEFFYPFIDVSYSVSVEYGLLLSYFYFAT